MAGVGGRPKGSTNLQNKAIKDMIRAALDKKGGSAYFERVAEENQTAFCTLIGKLIPAELNIGGQENNPIKSQSELKESDKALLNKFMEIKGVKL